MIFVRQQRTLYRAGSTSIEPTLEEWAVREVRSHVFRRNEGSGRMMLSRRKRAVRLLRSAMGLMVACTCLLSFLTLS